MLSGLVGVGAVYIYFQPISHLLVLLPLLRRLLLLVTLLPHMLFGLLQLIIPGFSILEDLARISQL